MRIERFLVPVGQELVIRVELRKERGRLAGFVCQLEVDDGAGIVPVVRYDTNHGHLHVHKFWVAPDSVAEGVEVPGRPARDYTRQLDQALADLVRNHSRYLARIKGGRTR